MPSKLPTRKVLFPTRIALILVLPSLLLYLFFNIWPMIFSIGIAFTNADKINILPNPEKIQDLKNAVMCAEYLKTSAEYREKAAGLLYSIDDILGSLEGNLTEIKRILDVNGLWSEIEPYVNSVSSLSGRIRDIRVLRWQSF